MDIYEIKEFLIIEHEDDDLLLESLKLAAEEYLDNAGVRKDYTKELYKLAIKMLINHWYGNREIVGEAKELSFSLKSIIIQLNYRGV